MSAQLHLKLAARPEALERINGAIAELGEREDWPPKLLFRVNLVLEELGLNVMTHGQAAGARELEVILISEADTVTIEMVDDGPRFDPLQDAPLPDPEASLDERPVNESGMDVGGLGIHLVRTMMDEVHYRYQDGKNHLLLVTGTSA